MSAKSTRNCYDAMMHRCYSRKCASWEYYGSRGITVCDEWRGNFKAFVRDMGERPDGLSIDRIDNDKGYSKENCRWVTPKQSARNRRNGFFVEAFGKRLTVAEWAELNNLTWAAITGRLEDGWTPEDAVSKPIIDSKFKKGESWIIRQRSRGFFGGVVILKEETKP